MATFDAIPNTELDIDKAVKSSTAKKFRDNPEAIFEGDATALAAGKGVFVQKDPGAGLQTAIITDETDAKKVLRPDGAGSVEWGSSLGMTLVERKEITGSSVSSVTFSGLDGNTDEVYKLIGRIKRLLAATVGQFSIRPNGLTTNQGSRLIKNGVSSTDTILTFFDTSGTQTSFAFEMLIHARDLFSRTFQGKSIGVDSIAKTVPEIEDFGGIWTGAGNIVSLEIVSTFPPQINIGSTFELFKLAQA